MIASEVMIDENQQEFVPRNDAGFPVYTCYQDFSRQPGGYVPWHWHPETELMRVLQGSIRLMTSSHTFTIREGEGYFANANILHYLEPLPGPAPIALNQVFDPRLIAGESGSVFERKYVAPILECPALEVLLLKPSDSRQRNILELFRHSYDAADRMEEGYEVTVRNDLSSAWFLLYKEAEALLRTKKPVAEPSAERVKQMMRFIHAHYTEKLSLGQIASAASVSEREALRCFSQILNITPFTCLLEYRIRRAADELTKTDRSVTDIAYGCGFGGTSYFSKVFRKFMGCTPSAYRKTHRQ